jgi:predicted ATPase/class 3 adenylate cyclase/DNA-binding CsgD family transcriptional regulator/Tfp pilus assembly protein PilF
VRRPPDESRNPSDRRSGSVPGDDATTPPVGIRTPDQRVRVFVSSTLDELAPERQAAREAIARLRLIPVLFDSGAHSHPPRELYRAYLAQSAVFVGLYWQRYGWVAPCMHISGLEDEYRLSGERPKLIYVKTPAPEREPRLQTLLDQVRAEEVACYQKFATPEELSELLQNDLAVLLTEHFEQARRAPLSGASPSPESPDLPTGTVTFLFTDIEGSTRLLQQLGDRYAEVLTAHQRCLRDAFAAHGGYEVDTQGESFFVAFPTAPDALAAAAQATRALVAHSWPEETPLRVRMGLHTGAPPLVGERYVGLDVHRAARIAAAGHGGQILLSAAAAELARHDLPDGITLRDLGAHRLKDLQQAERIYQAILPELPVDFPPLQALDARPHNLPIQPTLLLGREREVAAVTALLRREDVRLVTLTGTGGVGKTRLALEVAAAVNTDFADGICFVALAPLIDPGLVLSTIAQALGVREQGSRPLLACLQDHLREQHLLLLLDNFEQIVSAAPIVTALLAAAPRVHALVTSRAALHLSGEHEFVVPPLSLPDLRDLPPPDRLSEYGAVSLFIARAQAVHSAFALTAENAPFIAAICQQVDGLPLAIELAAGRSKLLSPQALLPRLQSRLTLLVGGARDLPVRQQTLRQTIDWSYDLLEEHEQRLFRRLAVFVGGCTLEAAEAICHGQRDLEEDLLDGVARLVDQSLLRHETQANGEPRLLLLETIRDYGLERLKASGEADTLRRQHATFFLQLALEADAKSRSAEQSLWYNRLEADHDNLRAALRWTLERKEAEMGLQLAGGLYSLWRLRDHLREGRNWLAQVLAQPGAQARTAARAQALRALGFLAFVQGDFPEAQRLLEQSVSIGRELGAAGRRELAHALATLAHVSLLQGHLSAARELAEESRLVFQEVEEAWGTALALHHQGRATVELGAPLAARSLLEESATLFRMIGDRQLLAQSLNTLGLVALRQGDHGAARAQFEEALAVAREMGDKKFIAEALTHLGTVALRMGASHESRLFYQQSLALNRDQGYKEGIAEDLAGLAEGASLLGHVEQAACLFGAVESLREASGIGLSPLRRTEYDRTVESIRAQLDEAAFVEAWARGRAMPLEQAMTQVVETIDAPLTLASPGEADQEEVSSALPPGVISSPPSPPLSPRRALKQQFGGLTAREREVARLVAQGKTNRAIADELGVRVSTVEAHLSHIFTKLGFASRAQVAAWAVDRGLAHVPQGVESTKQEH